ncbi:hypothetical protein B5X24_HaOG212373, partial [Helicoverpa armigera]
LGIDRIVDLQFGSGEAAYHVILELYDRGNIVLTDHEWTILNVLRPHVEGDKIRFAVKEKYPLDRAKTSYAAPSTDALQEILATSKPGDNLKKVLNPKLEFGSAIIDHVLLENGLSGTMKLTKEPGKGFHVEQDLEKLVKALKEAEELLDIARKQVAKGYITQKKEVRPNPEGEGTSFLLTSQEFHPMLFSQHREMPHVEHETFDRAVDEFFSTLEGQKIDLKTVQVEREAMKKLQNVRKDHEKRVTELTRVQDSDKRAAELISRNQPLVEQARRAVQAAIANQLEDSCIERHRDERKPIAIEDASDVTSTQDLEEDQEIPVSDDDEPSDKEEDKPDSNKLDAIKEEPQTTQDLKEAQTAQDIAETKEIEREENEQEKEGEDNEQEKEGDEKEEDESDSDSESSEDEFPDTHIKVDHGTGEVFVQSKSRTFSETSDKTEDKMPSFPALPRKGGKKPQKQQKAQKTAEEKREEKGSAKGEKESKKAQKKAAAAKANKVKTGPRGVKIPQPAPLILEAESDPEEVDPEPDTEQPGPDADTEMLCQLTGIPHTEDELLFAVPVVAPYSALNNYKYKVKLTPGASKRGKAAKTAVQVFLRDKAGTPREKDLLKAVKEENIARNFPGKVKLSAPQLHKHKK